MIPRYFALGEQTVLVELGQDLSEAANSRVHAYAAQIREAGIRGVRAVIPAFASLSITYDPLLIGYGELLEQLESIGEPKNGAGDADESRTLHVPVAYGGVHGEDLPYVAEQTGLTQEQVVELHSSVPYMVFMLGFIAGCPYCGECDERLALARRPDPRLRVEKGSVGIANLQTFVYSIASPGGWHIIGRTPMETFDPLASRPTPFTAGGEVRFVPITEEQFNNWDDVRQSEWDAKWNV